MKVEENDLPVRSRRDKTRFLWVKKLMLAGGSVLCVVGGLELASWLAGFEPAFHREDPYSGFSRHVPHFVESPRTNGTTLLSVAPNKAKVLNPQTFQREKPEGVFRIVCVGGSSTYGRPFFDATSFPGWLRALLPAAQGTRSWEVINAGALSYASYRDVGLMEELARYQPDLFIVYSGHNEFLERRTYAGLADRSPVITSALSLVSRTRTATLVRDVFDRAGIRRVQSAHRAPVLGENTQSIAVNAVGTEAYHRDPSFSREVVEHFSATLESMIHTAHQAGAEIVFVVPASNLADFVPFKSEHRQGLTDRELSLWNRHFAAAQELWSKERWPEALAEMERAERIDNQFAAAWFLKGRILQAMGDVPAAKASFEKARDEDVCPLRAISPIAAAVRDIGLRRGKAVVDFEAIVARHSEHGLPGRAMFHDHVHLSIEANRLMALAIMTQLQKMGVVKPDQPWDEAAVQRVRSRVLEGVDPLLHARELRHLAAMLGWLRQTDLARHQADLSLELSGHTEEAFLDLASRWRSNGSPELAVEYCRKAVSLDGDSARRWAALGMAWLEAGNASEGIRALQKAIAMDPDDVESRTRAGIALALRGDLEEAAVHLKEAIRLKPDSGTVRGNYGLVLARQGKLQEAIEEYEAALELDPASPSVHFNLGVAKEESGNAEEAAHHYRSALRAQPGHAKAQERLLAMTSRNQPGL
jgi:tetratricopeptide (TPR) repeat protein